MFEEKSPISLAIEEISFAKENLSALVLDWRDVLSKSDEAAASEFDRRRQEEPGFFELLMAETRASLIASTLMLTLKNGAWKEALLALPSAKKEPMALSLRKEIVTRAIALNKANLDDFGISKEELDRRKDGFFAR